MPTSRIQRIVHLAGIFALFIAYTGLWVRFIKDPVERTGSDFIGFYSVGRIAQESGAPDVYDPLLQQAVQQQVVGFDLAPGQVLINQHLPFLIPVLQAIVTSDYIESFYRWNLFMLVFYLVGIVVLGRLLKNAGLKRNQVVMVSLGGLLFYPLYFSLLNGQDTALAFLGISIWLFGMVTGKDIYAGLGLSLVTVRPHIALVLAIPMFFQRRKAFWGFAIGAGMLALFSVALLGIQGTWDFINVLLISAEGQWYGLNEDQMLNLVGLLLRLLPMLNADTIHIIGWLAFGAAILGLSTWRMTRDSLKTGQIGSMVTIAVFVAPHLHYHDLTLLLIPIYELILSGAKTDSPRESIFIALPVILSFVFLLGNLSPILQYLSPYLIMLGLGAYPFFDNKQPTSLPRRS